jgi:hypothetical protein
MFESNDRRTIGGITLNSQKTNLFVILISIGLFERIIGICGLYRRFVLV